VKLKLDGYLEILKVRLIIRGFTQHYGINYQEIFSTVQKIVTIRNVIAFGSIKTLDYLN